ncbi:MAG TPA: hypothetical protein VKR06_28700 [Ktedonosporobacter sp.]|nr:hypothetical protein [Ktedonosporobacter sp.]
MKEFSQHVGRIVQMMGVAPQWQAVYALTDGEVVMEPLVCWALVEEKETGETSIVGMVAEGSSIEVATSENFLGYNYPGCKADWDELAKQHKKE